MLMLVVMLFLVNNVLTKIAKANGIEVAKKNQLFQFGKHLLKINF
jgi:hypothetical protein